jgi:hypothetical protein
MSSITVGLIIFAALSEASSQICVNVQPWVDLLTRVSPLSGPIEAPADGKVCDSLASLPDGYRAMMELNIAIDPDDYSYRLNSDVLLFNANLALNNLGPEIKAALPFGSGELILDNPGISILKMPEVLVIQQMDKKKVWPAEMKIRGKYVKLAGTIQGDVLHQWVHYVRPHGSWETTASEVFNDHTQFVVYTQNGDIDNAVQPWYEVLSSLKLVGGRHLAKPDESSVFLAGDGLDNLAVMALITHANREIFTPRIVGGLRRVIACSIDDFISQKDGLRKIKQDLPEFVAFIPSDPAVNAGNFSQSFLRDGKCMQLRATIQGDGRTSLSRLVVENDWSEPRKAAEIHHGTPIDAQTLYLIYEHESSCDSDERKKVPGSGTA